MTIQILSKLVIFAIICTIALSSCLPKKNYGDGKDCKVYYDYVLGTWQRNPDGYFALTKPADYDEELSEFKRLTHKPCLLGLSKKHIIKLFGEPSKQIDNRFEYFMNDRCERENYYGCLRIKIFFDQQGFVDSIPPYIMKESPPIK